MKRILILAVNPKDTSNLDLRSEVREIQHSLERGRNGVQYKTIAVSVMRIDELYQAILYHQPAIVHFSTGGRASQGLAFENNSKQTRLLSQECLGKLFKFSKERIECVLFNGCYNEAQAEAVYQHVDTVIGLNQAIAENGAIKFASWFYNAVSAGKSYEDCYKIGCAAIGIEKIPQVNIPVIKTRAQSTSLGKTKVEFYPRLERKQKPLYLGGNNQNFQGMKIDAGVWGNYNQLKTPSLGFTVNKKQLTQSEVIVFLAWIEHLITKSSTLPGIEKEKSLRYLLVAAEEAEAREPDKELAANSLKRMALILKNSSETTISKQNIWENIKPIIIPVSSWLGVNQNFLGF